MCFLLSWRGYLHGSDTFIIGMLCCLRAASTYIKLSPNEEVEIMNNDIIDQLRQELEQISGTSWPSVQSWIDKATPIINQHFPQLTGEFLRIAVAPPELQTDALWLGGTKEEFARFKETLLASHDARNQSSNGVVKQELLSFLERIQK